MKLFIAGIMQGSLSGNEVHNQDYRTRIKGIILQYMPTAQIVCPWELYPASVSYGPAKARETLLTMMEEAGRCDVLIAYLPEASMGTALEMWKAHEAGRTVLSISPLKYNWVVMCLSDHVFETLEEFEQFIASGGLSKASQSFSNR